MTKKEIYPKYITKINIKQKYTIIENLLFTFAAFIVFYFLLFLMCYTFANLDKIIFSL